MSLDLISCRYEIVGSGIYKELHKTPNPTHSLIEKRCIENVNIFIHGSPEQKEDVDQLVKVKMKRDLRWLKMKYHKTSSSLGNSSSSTQLSSESSTQLSSLSDPSRFNKSPVPILTNLSSPELTDLIKNFGAAWKAVFIKYFEFLVQNIFSQRDYEKLSKNILKDMIPEDIDLAEKTLKEIEIIARKIAEKTGKIGLTRLERFICTTELFNRLTSQKEKKTKAISTKEKKQLINNILKVKIRKYNQPLAILLIVKTVEKAQAFLKKPVNTTILPPLT